MKKNVFCLLALIIAMAISDVSACTVKRAKPQADVVVIDGVVGMAGDPCYPNSDCADCIAPIIIYNGIHYYVNEKEQSWESYFYRELGIGTEVTVSGILSEDCCFHFIDIVSIKKKVSSPEAIEDVASLSELDMSQPMYNTLGVQVDPAYHGIVIQNGQKFIR